MLGIVSTATAGPIFVLSCVAGLALFSVGCLLLRFRVVVNGNSLTSYNYKGGKRTTTADKIEAVDLAARPWPAPTRPVTVRVPYVRLKESGPAFARSSSGHVCDLPPPQSRSVIEDSTEGSTFSGRVDPPETSEADDTPNNVLRSVRT